MNALETVLALASAAERLGLSQAMRAIAGEALKEHPELAPPPPPGSRDAIDAEIDAELAARGLGRDK